MEDRCAHCYVVLERRQKCGKCKRRLFCSKDCQVSDWTAGKHKVYCGRTGEMGTDIRVDELPGRGKALVALRHFVRWEKIVVERPAIVRPHGPRRTGAGVSEVLAELSPHDGTEEDKFRRNRIALSDSGGTEGLCLFLSFINHNCLGNSDHWYDSSRGAVVLAASRDIQVGEEITFGFVGILSSADKGLQERRLWLQHAYGITCECPACIDPETDQKIQTAKELYHQMPVLASAGRLEAAMAAGRRHLQILSDLSANSRHLSSTHFDLMRIAKAARKWNEAAHHERCYKELDNVFL